MFSKGWPAILLALVTCVVGRSSLSSRAGVNATPANPNIFQRQYLIETSSHSVLRELGGGGDRRRSFYDRHRKRNINFEVGREYNVPEIFIGSVIKVTDGEDVSALSEIDGVISVYPVRYYSPPKPVSSRTLGDPNDPTIPDPLSTHIMTGVDKVHAQGFTGKGIKIGIIDTGIDYTHPTLGGGFGPGFKVGGGYDLVGDNFNGSNTPVPDPDPLDQCFGHGTHVAGIIGANPGNEYNISGVAYDATIYAYRIFGCSGGSTSPVILDALIRAFNAGMDIITLSFGEPGGFSEDEISVVVSRIVNKGRVVTVAAGNDGEFGPWYTSSPGTGKGVISVGSVDKFVTGSLLWNLANHGVNSTRLRIQNATIYVNGEEVTPIPYSSAAPLTNVTTPFEIYATSTNTSSTDDACEPLPEDTPDLTGKVVIIHRGTCALAQKCEHAAKFGARLFLIYNNFQSFGSIRVENFTAALIQEDRGAFLVDNFAQGKNVTISFSNLPAELPNTDTGGIMSSFSSLGPSYELDFKPAISAPGGDILSTLPLNTFGLASGTSMSTPFVAGSAALVLQARGKTKSVALAMRDILESTASHIASNLTDTKPLQTLIQSGAGLIQVDRAINTTTLVHPGHLCLNDTANFQPIQTVTVTNLGDEPVTYSLAHVPAGTIYTYDGPEVVLPPFTLTTDYATVEFNRSSFTVNPGQSSTITANFTAPAIDAKGYPAYSGHIEITSPLETLTVSYLGVLGSVHEQQLLDHSDVPLNFSLPLIQLPDGSVQNATTKYTFTDEDYPTLVLRLLYGSPLISVDLVTVDSKEGPHLEVVGNLELDNFTSRTLAEELLPIPIMKNFSNGTTIPDGEYRIFLKALKVFGQPDNPEDSETYLSPIIEKIPAAPSVKTGTPS